MKQEIEVNLTPDELAEMFIGWGDTDQAEFLNLIGKHFKKADFDSEFQCCLLSDHIDKDGKDLIYTLANFLKVQKFTDKSPHYDRLINTYDGDTLRKPAGIAELI